MRHAQKTECVLNCRCRAAAAGGQLRAAAGGARRRGSERGDPVPPGAHSPAAGGRAPTAARQGASDRHCDDDLQLGLMIRGQSRLLIRGLDSKAFRQLWSTGIELPWLGTPHVDLHLFPSYGAVCSDTACKSGREQNAAGLWLAVCIGDGLKRHACAGPAARAREGGGRPAAACPGQQRPAQRSCQTTRARKAVPEGGTHQGFFEPESCP
jgi:hypothetical protein